VWVVFAHYSPVSCKPETETLPQLVWGRVSPYTTEKRIIMARFHDLLATLTEEQIAALPEGIVDSLTEEYDNDLSISNAAVQERELRIAARDAAIAEKEAEAIKLKAANWDMLQATPAAAQATDDDELDGDAPDDDDIFG
jgi:hypothetical protein